MKNQLWNNIPDELRKLNQWVFWRLEERNGKKTKIPYNPKSGHPASTTNPDTWASFEQACRSSVNGNGIGFVFVEGGGYVGLDIDHATEPELIEWFGTYAERSQSGKGVHIIMRGELPQRFNDETSGVGRRSGTYELYQRARYFVVTGDVLHAGPIVDCQSKLDQFILEVFPAPKEYNKPDLSQMLATPTATTDILDKIRNSGQSDKFNRLWSGQWQSDYASQSDADAGLLAILRFWTGGNQAESFALFKQSGLMRDKANRADYLPRTWRYIDKGEVYTPIEPVPAQFVQRRNQAIPPWRQVSIAHVEAAIEGTILGPLVKALCSPTDPPLPLEVGLAKALPLCGCALAGKAEKQTLGQFISRGGDLARLRIMTGGGQICNFWTLLVGESASGKDIGGIADKAAMQFKWLIGSAGSEEGIADAYIRMPTGLLSVSEMVNWLDKTHWQSRAVGFLLHAFNKGWFSHAMSSRGTVASRESNYCYPNIIASVQPGIISANATQAHVDNGFLSRFLILQMPDFIPYPRCGSLDKEVATVVDALKILNSKQGDIVVQPKYNQALNEQFFTRGAHPASSWKRLTGEYYPRLALLLSIPVGDTSTEAVITPDGWNRATVLVNYLFAQAETVFGNLHFDAQTSKFEGLCGKMLNMIDKMPEKKVSKNELGRLLGRGTTTKQRDEALRELVDRQVLIAEQIAENKVGRPTLYYRIP